MCISAGQAFGVIYNHLIGPLPNWFPISAKAGIVQIGGQPAHLGDTLLGLFILTPFLLIGAALILVVLMMVFGKICVVINTVGSYATTTLGLLRWKQRFDASRVRSIELIGSRWQPNSSFGEAIVIESNRPIRIRHFKNDEQMWWMLGVLTVLLVPDESGGNPARSIAHRWAKLQGMTRA